MVTVTIQNGKNGFKIVSEEDFIYLSMGGIEKAINLMAGKWCRKEKTLAMFLIYQKGFCLNLYSNNRGEKEEENKPTFDG